MISPVPAWLIIRQQTGLPAPAYTPDDQLSGSEPIRGAAAPPLPFTRGCAHRYFSLLGTA